jgi:hypothetical protein
MIAAQKTVPNDGVSTAITIVMAANSAQTPAIQAGVFDLVTPRKSESG